MISYEEFEKKVVENIRKHDLPEEYIEELIKRGCIRVDYEEKRWATDFLGTDQMSTDAYGYNLFYPDFPTSYDEYQAQLTDSNVFDFQFQGVRPQST